MITVAEKQEIMSLEMHAIWGVFRAMLPILVL